MAKTCHFKQGFNEAVRKIEGVERRPIMVAVYGYPNSGKSFLLERIANYFRARKFSISAYNTTPTREGFILAKPYFENYPFLLQNTLCLYHCPWDRNYICTNANLHEDPNILAKEILNKDLDLNIGIFNPHHVNNSLDGEYDLLISNPNSKIKCIF